LFSHACDVERYEREFDDVCCDCRTRKFTPADDISYNILPNLTDKYAYRVAKSGSRYTSILLELKDHDLYLEYCSQINGGRSYSNHKKRHISDLDLLIPAQSSGGMSFPKTSAECSVSVACLPGPEIESLPVHDIQRRFQFMLDSDYHLQIFFEGSQFFPHALWRDIARP